MTRAVRAPRRTRVVVLAVVATAALAGCRDAGEPGGPGTQAPSPTVEPTAGPTPGPTTTTEPTAAPTDPGGPTLPGGSEGIEVSVEIEDAFTMPNLLEVRLQQARAELARHGAETVVVVDARDAGPVAGAANGWTVCTQDPDGGTLVRESRTVTLAAAPNARHCS